MSRSATMSPSETVFAPPRCRSTRTSRLPCLRQVHSSVPRDRSCAGPSIERTVFALIRQSSRAPTSSRTSGSRIASEACTRSWATGLCRSSAKLRTRMASPTMFTKSHETRRRPEESRRNPCGPLAKMIEGAKFKDGIEVTAGGGTAPCHVRRGPSLARAGWGRDGRSM